LIEAELLLSRMAAAMPWSSRYAWNFEGTVFGEELLFPPALWDEKFKRSVMSLANSLL
jgi:hypothetical protein